MISIFLPQNLLFLTSNFSIQKMAKKDFKKGQKHIEIVEEIAKPKTFSNSTIYTIIIAFAFLIYGNSILNDYALDDAIVITENKFTKKGFSGIEDILKTEFFTGFFGVQKNLVAGGRYRPLSVVTFAVEYEFFGQNPHISHLINILLYALTGILLFVILSRLFRDYKQKTWYFSIPFLASILWIAHPIHTEAVTNIKGRDEILAFLGSLLSLYYTLKYLDFKKFYYLIFSGIAFLLSLMSKENSITFLVVIPLTVYFFTDFSFKKNIVSTIPMILTTIVFLVIRQSILKTPILGGETASVPQELMNNSFLGATIADKYATISLTLGYYIKLLFLPHPLTYDYYPYMIPIVNWSDLRAIFPLIIHIVLAFFALKGLKSKNVYSYSIWFYAITFSLTTNVLFPIGVFMNERFLYIPSLGFVIIVAMFLVEFLPKFIKNEDLHKKVLASTLLIVLLLFTVKTISRNTAWENDFVLFTTDVKVSGNSAKSTTSAGGKLTEEAIKPENADKRDEYLKQAIEYLNKAVEIHPTYADALLLLGNAHYHYNKNFTEVMKAYNRILAINPNYDKVYTNLSIMFAKNENQDEKLKIYESLLKIAPNRYDVNYNLGSLYGKYKNDLDLSIQFLERAKQINPNPTEVYKDLGVAYGLKKDFRKSAENLEIAYSKDPKDAQMLVNLGLSYLNFGEKQKAEQAILKASEIDTKFKKVYEDIFKK